MAKLNLLFRNTKFSKHEKFLPIKQYLENIPSKKFPHHIFKPQQPDTKSVSDRASDIRFKTLTIKKTSKDNLANRMASLAIHLAKTNKLRHQAVQDFFLINDSTTIASEIPIYLTRDDLLSFVKAGFYLDTKEYNAPVTGHIDILQIRNNLIHILDYKPEASKIQPIHQLTTYALALASRTKLKLKDFKCAWFGENNYYEFFPLQAVYKKRTRRLMRKEEGEKDVRLDPQVFFL